jgi:Protein of unknown function (DUF3990)
MVWTNAPLVVYHGTDENAAGNILRYGIRLAACLPGSDFGRGFYVTSSLRFAQNWADQKVVRSMSSIRAAVLVFHLDRDMAADLDDHLAFVLASDEFFDFVEYNHGGATDHARSGGTSYDLVYGPTSAYPLRLVYVDCDQICFLNQKALGCLLGPAGNPSYGNPRFLP